MKTIAYRGEIHKYHIGHKWNYDKQVAEEVYYIMRPYGNDLLEAMPRYGKSSLSKDLTVKISKHRQVVVFDYNGEWANSLGTYNYDAPYPDRMVNYRVIKNFTFNVMDFSSPGDFVSLGFDSLPAHTVCEVIHQSAWYHKGDLNLISEVLNDLPVKKDQHHWFNRKYRTARTGPINFSTKSTLTTWWDMVRPYFWQPDDDRSIFNFGDLLLSNDHLIIDLGAGQEFLSKAIARAYCGKILQQMKPVWIHCKPFFLFEEARMLFPRDESRIMLSSNEAGYNLVTMAPKEGVSAMFLCQHEEQLFAPLLENIHRKIIGVVRNPPPSPEFKIKLEFNPATKTREFLLLDINSTPNNLKYTKFRPVTPAVRYESQL